MTTSNNDFKAGMKYVKDLGERNRKENARLVKRYFDELDKSGDEDIAISVVCDAFDCTPVRVKNQVSKATGHLNPATKALSEAKLLIYMEKMGNLVDSAIEYGIDRLDSLGRLDDDDMVVVERIGSNDKSVPVWRQKKDEYRSLIEHQMGVFKAIKSLLPQTVLNNVINNTSDVMRMTDDELDRELEIENNRYSKGESS